jgi:rod shape-determining protein MreC
MSGTFATRLARRRAVTYAGLVMASLVLLAISSNPLVLEVQRGVGFALRPVQSWLDGVGRDIATALDALGEFEQVRLENDALREENERLRNENRQAEELRRQNDLLTALLQLRNGFEYETVPAVVIARESSEFRRTVTIDRGTDDGLTVGDVVVAAGGALAGRVIEIGPNFARVLLISDGASTVIGQLLESAATGEVGGGLGGTLSMRNVDSTVTIVVGEEVTTAGIELAGGLRSPFPKGLIIGRVVDVDRSPNEVVQTAYLEPAADLERLEYLLVITDYEGGLPGPGELPTACDPTGEGTLPDSEVPCVTPTPLPLPTSRP